MFRWVVYRTWFTLIVGVGVCRVKGVGVGGKERVEARCIEEGNMT